MSAASFHDSGGEETNDGYHYDYIMENIKSPEKASSSAPLPITSSMKAKKSSDTSAAPVPDMKTLKKAAIGSPVRAEVSENERDQYVENLRKLIITARSRISELETKNDELQKRVDSDCIVRCPSCTYEFKEKDHVVLPKFMRIFRPRLSLEMEFYTEEDLDKYVHANRIGHDRDGVPVQVPVGKPKKTLLDVGSTLSDCVKEQEAKTPGLKLRISLKKDPRVLPTQEPPAPPKQPPPNFVPAGSETPQDGLVIAEESDVDSIVMKSPEARVSVAMKMEKLPLPTAPKNRAKVAERKTPAVKGAPDPREEAAPIRSNRVDNRLRKPVAKEVNEPAIMRETFGMEEVPGRSRIGEKPTIEAKVAPEGARAAFLTRVSFPTPSTVPKRYPTHDPRAPLSARVTCPSTSSTSQTTDPKDHSVPASSSDTLSTDEWRNAMSGIFDNPSGEIGLELPPKCALPSKKIPEPVVLPPTKQPEVPVASAPIVLPATETTPKTPRRISPRKRQLERDLEMSASPEKCPAVNTAASRNERYRNRTAAKEAEEKKDPEPDKGASRSSERRASRNIRYRESPPPARRDRSRHRNSRSSDTDRSLERGAIRDARSIAIEHEKRRGETTAALPLKSSENRQVEKARGRSPTRRRKEDEVERRRDEDRRMREEDERRKMERDEEERRKREETERKRDEERRRREREETEKQRNERNPRARRDYQRVVDSFANGVNGIPLGQRKLAEPLSSGRARRRSPEESTSRQRQAASRPSRRSPRKSTTTREPATPVRSRRRSPVDDNDAPYSKRPRHNPTPAPKASFDADSSSKEEGEISDDEEYFPETVVTRNSSRLSHRAAAGRERKAKSTERFASEVPEERKTNTPEPEVVDENGNDSDDSATIEVYDEMVPMETLKATAKLPVTFDFEEERKEEEGEKPAEYPSIVRQPLEDEEMSEEQEEMVIIDDEEVIVSERMEEELETTMGEMRSPRAVVDSDESVDDEEEEEENQEETHYGKQEEEERSGSEGDSEESGSDVSNGDASSEAQEHVEEEEKDHLEEDDEDEEEPSGSRVVVAPEFEGAGDGDDPDEEMEVSDAEQQGSSSASDGSQHSDDGSGSSSGDDDDDPDEEGSSVGDGNKRRKNSSEEDDEGSGGDDDFAEWGQVVERDEDVFSDSFVPDDDDIVD